MSEQTQGPAVKPAVPARRNVLLPIVLVVNMLGLVGVGAYVFMTNSAGAQTPSHAHGEDGEEGDDEEGEEEEDEEEGEESEPGPLVEFESMIVNLHADTTDRYLKVTFSLELGSEEDLEHCEARMTAFRDRVLMHLTALTADQVLGVDNATVQHDQLLVIAREVMGRRAVRHIYFTEYLVQ